MSKNRMYHSENLTFKGKNIKVKGALYVQSGDHLEQGTILCFKGAHSGRPDRSFKVLHNIDFQEYSEIRTWDLESWGSEFREIGVVGEHDEF